MAGDFEGFKDYILNNDLINIVVPEGSLLNYTITEGKEKVISIMLTMLLNLSLEKVLKMV